MLLLVIDSWCHHGCCSWRCWLLLWYVFSSVCLPCKYLRIYATSNTNHLKPGRSPTGATSEKSVPMAKNSMPWETGSSGKYQYHPGADPNASPKDAPSAVNVVVVPNVTLPAVWPTLFLADYFYLLLESGLCPKPCKPVIGT